MANKNDSSNSTMITLIVIVIIALGVLFFLKPFGATPEINTKEEIRRTSLEDTNLNGDKSFPPGDDEVKPVNNPPVKRASEEKK